MCREPNIWKRAIARTGAALTVALIAAHGSAWAGCANPDSSGKPEHAAQLVSAVYHADGPGRGTFIRLRDGDDDRPAIVGLWKFEMLSKSTSTNTNPMPDGTLIDFGTAAWHGDGTELMNSGSRNPSDGDFCQGVWKQVGRSTFVLNHIALAWSNGAYVGPAKIEERVTVSADGSKLSGTFMITQYLASITAGHEFDETSVAPPSITGTITGTRITPN